MHVTGRGGASLREQWGEEPTAYLGITVPNFPNLFCVCGPGTNLAAGAGLFSHSEFQVHYASLWASCSNSGGPAWPSPKT
jgi:4-hydroxyacetophenone monooxygenase